MATVRRESQASDLVSSNAEERSESGFFQRAKNRLLSTSLYQHAGTSGRFQQDTDDVQFSRSYFLRTLQSFRKRFITPIGVVHFSLSSVQFPAMKPLPNAIRCRFSLNGQVEVGLFDLSKKRLVVELEHFSEVLDNEDEEELVVEMNDARTDCFLGTASLAMGSVVGGPRIVELLNSNRQVVGEMSCEIAYNRLTLQDRNRIRLKFVRDYPKQVFKTWMNRIKNWVYNTGSLLANGELGESGPWLIVALVTLPFWFFTLFTNFSWASRQWLLVIPLYLYVYVNLPAMLGWVFANCITVFALHNYPGRFHCAALHVSLWVKDYSLHARITCQDFGMGNPPGFEIPHFWFCRKTDLTGSVSFQHLLDCLLLRYKPCPLRRVSDFSYLAKFTLDSLDVEDFFLDFQLHEGVMNVWEVTHLLAELEVKKCLPPQAPFPNQLEIRIIRAKDLVKTKDGKSNVSSIPAATTPFAKNAVFEAFMEVEQEDEADNNDGEDMEQPEDQDIHAKKTRYRGLGPPNFNPMDMSVRASSKQGEFDPYVLVSLRRDKQETKTQTQTNSPMFNETFYFEARDAATVVLVQVFNRESGGSVLIGQWFMTLKYMVTNPRYCWHEKGLEVNKEDGWVRGWFPLVNKKLRGIGLCGKLEMAFQWSFVEKLKRPVQFPVQSALAQLSENTEETRLRMGDMARIKYWLNHEPFLFDLQRMSVRNFKMFLNDIFVPGNGKGQAETKGVDMLHFVEVPRVDWLEEFHPKHGDAGLTCYQMLFEFFAGIAPKVLNTAQSKANVGQTLSVLAGIGVKKLVTPSSSSNNAVGKQFQQWARNLRNSFQVTHRHATQNKDNELQFKVPVVASDEDFLLDKITLSGHLSRYAVQLNNGGVVLDVDMEQESQRKGVFRRKYFELKGRTLFFRKNKHFSGSVYGVSYKLPLSQVLGAIYFVQQEELMLNMQGGVVTRLRLLANDVEEGDDKEEDEQQGFDRWIAALKEAGVPIVNWNRE